MKLNTDTKLREPAAGDFFVVSRQSNHMTSYLVCLTRENKYLLTNMHSGQANYSGDSIEELVKNFFEINGSPEMNPITHYFFLKGHESTFTNKRPFGHTKVNVPKITRQQLTEKFSTIRTK